MITRFSFAAAIALVVMAWLSLREAYIHKGEVRAATKVTKQNETVRKKAQAVTAKSADPASRGVLNPYYRD